MKVEILKAGFGKNIGDVITINAYKGLDMIYRKQARLVDIDEKNMVVDSAGIDTTPIPRAFTYRINMPNNKDPYPAGSVIVNTDGALSKFLNVAKANGYAVRIENIHLQTNDPSGMTGKNVKLHFLRDEIAPLADKAALTILDANSGKRKGSFGLTFGPTAGTTAKVAQELYANMTINPVGRDIYFVFEDVDGHTPSVENTWIDVTVTFTLLN
jgi:hypothetical protein